VHRKRSNGERVGTVSYGLPKPLCVTACTSTRTRTEQRILSRIRQLKRAEGQVTRQTADELNRHDVTAESQEPREGDFRPEPRGGLPGYTSPRTPDVAVDV
jgi:hypothetical protein